MSNTSLTEALQRVLADTYALYLKTQNYHWNVKGPSFRSLHKLFESQYTDYAEAIDEIAERIRILGELAPGSFDIYNKLKSIEDANPTASAADMIKHLADDQDLLIQCLKSAISTAASMEDEVTVGLLTDRVAVHEKNRWMLSSSL